MPELHCMDNIKEFAYKCETYFSQFLLAEHYRMLLGRYDSFVQLVVDSH